MRCLVAQAARQFGDAPALVAPSATLTYSEYDHQVGMAAARLIQLGVKPCMRVALLLPNGIDYVLLLMGLIRIGAVACPISTRLPKAGVDACIGKSGAELLITDFARHNNTIRSLMLAQLLSQSISSPCLPTELSLGRHATILFTSGSIGEPKAVLHSLGNHYHNALGSNENIRCAPDDSWLLSLPLYHVGGLGILFRALLGGGAVVCPDPEQVLVDSLTQFQITHLSLVSTQIQRLLSSTDFSALHRRQLRAILLGGGPIPFSSVETALKENLPIHTSYGLTEMASQVTTTPVSAGREQLRTSGKLLRHRTLTLGTGNEILVGGATRFVGYIDGPILAEPFDSQGLFASGDVGQLDSSGFLTILGRRDTMFVSGGENIYPEEIESALYQVEGVEQAAVVAVEDCEYGARPVAFVKSRIGLDPDRVKDQLREYLPGYKLPDRIFGWPSQLGFSGIKPDRHQLANLARLLTSH